MNQKYLVGQMVKVSFEGEITEAYQINDTICYTVKAGKLGNIVRPSAVGIIDNNITPIEGVDNVTSGQ